MINISLSSVNKDASLKEDIYVHVNAKCFLVIHASFIYDLVMFFSAMANMYLVQTNICVTTVYMSTCTEKSLPSLHLNLFHPVAQ